MNIKKVIKEKIFDMYDLAHMRTYHPVKSGGVLETFSEKPIGDCHARNVILPEVDLLIVIPAYNVEKYIERCIESVINQVTKYSFTVVVINDGSTDSTYDRILKYKDQVVIINQDNKGFSGARNRGLERINGNYIMFVDSDDYIPFSDVFEKMLDCAYENDADVVQSGYYMFVENDGIENTTFQFIYEGNEEKGKVTGYPWGKCYKSSLFLNIKFPEGFWFEDTIISWLVLPRCKSVSFCNTIGYAYRDNINGITHTCGQYRKSVDTIWITDLVCKQLLSYNISPSSVYELFIHQCYMNGRRIRKQPSWVLYEGFKHMIDNFLKYFQMCKLNCSLSKRNLEMEKAIKNQDYNLYRAVIKLL